MSQPSQVGHSTRRLAWVVGETDEDYEVVPFEVTEDLIDQARDAIYDLMMEGQMHRAMPSYSDLARAALVAALVQKDGGPDGR